MNMPLPMDSQSVLSIVTRLHDDLTSQGVSPLMSAGHPRAVRQRLALPAAWPSAAVLACCLLVNR